ncbi:unnamed protein product [Nippostrongylus brasiliensis]|uniref:Endo/exonuclease/phosphatase domain-containing protein n=1 Tax=Nippostrongylus brasiliensis TaxID=27835 RepID=A0A0N4YMQ3_NIPBR|nr:unnamed protein product [Nippostrongylus brasiliensis]
MPTDDVTPYVQIMIDALTETRKELAETKRELAEMVQRSEAILQKNKMLREENSELIANYRVAAIGPGDRPSDGETRHVIWLDDAKCNCDCYCVRGNRRPLTEPVLYFGSPKTTNGVGIAVSKRFRDSISEVKRFSDRLMKIMVITENGLHFFTAYAPQTGCSEHVKDEFWTLLNEKTAEIPPEEMIVVAGDLNGHVGTSNNGNKCHGGFGYGARNEDGERILEYACSHDPVIMNTTFRKRPSHFNSFYSGNTRSQIDYLLVICRDAKR